MSEVKRSCDADIEKTEELLQGLLGNYQEMVRKLSDFTDEDKLHEVKKMAKEMAEDLTKVQTSMHSIIDSFLFIEEPELADASIDPEFNSDLPHIRKELYSKYNQQIDNCISSYKSP